MGVRCHLFQPEAFGNEAESTGFEQGGTGFEEIVARGGTLAETDGGIPFFGGEEGQNRAAAHHGRLGFIDCAVGTEHEQQFLAFSRRFHHFHLVNVALKTFDGVPDVKHRRELHHDEGCLFQQARQQGFDVGRAVLDEHGLPSCLVATGGVQEDEVGERHPVQKILRCSADHFGVGESQQGEVVVRRFAEHRLLFHIDCLSEQRGEK